MWFKMEKKFYGEQNKEWLVDRCFYYSQQITRLVKELDKIKGVSK